MKLQRQNREDEAVEGVKIPKATWMADGTHWPGTWIVPGPEHSKGDHAGIIQVDNFFLQNFFIVKSIGYVTIVCT